jgi:hypothetical protein
MHLTFARLLLNCNDGLRGLYTNPKIAVVRTKPIINFGLLHSWIQQNYYSLQRRNSSAPLVPPKPNEFDMAYSSSALRA